MDKITEFADSVAKRAIDIFNTEGHLCPMFFCFTIDDEVAITPLDMSDKDAAAYVMGVMAKETNAIAVIHVTEAWMKAFKNKPDLSKPISEQEGSKEIIMISLETKKYTKQMIIEIPDDRKVELGKWAEMPGYSGRFTNFLQKDPPDEMYV